MRTPAALYPFCAELLPAVRHFGELQDEFALVRLYSPPGTGLCGRDAAYACNHPDIGIVVTVSLDMADPAWDTLLLIRVKNSDVHKAMKLEAIMEEALRVGKSVIYFDGDTEELSEQIFALAEAYPGKASLRIGDMSFPSSEKFEKHFARLQKPVILVGGLLEEADVFEALLCLASHIRQEGLHPLVLANHPIGKLFGFYSAGNLLDKHDLTESEKTMEINLLMQRLEHDEAPDIVLAEAPDAVMRFNNYDPNGFGIRSYMLCQAVAPDYFVCCVPYELADGRFIEAISTDLSYRLGCPINAAHASNVVVDSASLLQDRRISTVHDDMGKVNAQISHASISSQIPFFNVIEDGGSGLCGCLRNAAI